MLPQIVARARPSDSSTDSHRQVAIRAFPRPLPVGDAARRRRTLRDARAQLASPDTAILYSLRCAGPRDSIPPRKIAMLAIHELGTCVRPPSRSGVPPLAAAREKQRRRADYLAHRRGNPASHKRDVLRRLKRTRRAVTRPAPTKSAARTRTPQSRRRRRPTAPRPAPLARYGHLRSWRHGTSAVTARRPPCTPTQRFSPVER
ncbi:hypothetical protein CesoFtcFv8_009648 [Champsocephalus esox]|uniref:Uncharacterized protein n=1 Tax=Champsocephalus esox TaxID=159716 RepID=A0AAN8H224_9TELE|nr:hypothetical protein CesoFtcFv8_009648 [Champsocephalus esox]